MFEWWVLYASGNLYVSLQLNKQMVAAAAFSTILHRVSITCFPFVYTVYTPFPFCRLQEVQQMEELKVELYSVRRTLHHLQVSGAEW